MLPARGRVMAVQPLLREVLERREDGQAACLATDGVATRFAQCRASAYLSRVASLLARVAKRCEQSLFLVRLDRPSEGVNRSQSIAQNDQVVTRQVHSDTEMWRPKANQPGA